MKNILLIGMPGSGKTTIGRLLAKKLKRQFVDMDEYIVTLEDKSIPDIFKIGEDYFRQAESNCAKILSGKSSLVIASGGGIVTKKESMDYFKESLIIFINRPLENIIKDIKINTRPLLKDGVDKIQDLYKERIGLYKKYCHIEILNDKTLEEAVNEIINRSSSAQ